MSLFRQRAANLSPSMLLESRGTPGRRGLGSRALSPQDAMRHSAVWACVRLRANLVSSLPLDQYRLVDGLQVEIPGKPEVLLKPGALHLGGTRASMAEWLYATQSDLDRYGNTFGLVVEWSALGLPARIDLVDASRVVVVQAANGELAYRMGAKTYTAREVWHERQYVVAGLPVGLSPIAHAAYSIGQYTSAQEFALSWFDGGAKPAATLRNVARTLTDTQALEMKTRHEATSTGGGVLVMGKDWEYSMIGVDASQTAFLDAQRFSVADTCRFLDVPADMIDAGTSGSSVTYANLGQRNVQLLVTSIGPAVSRRENALTELTSRPRFVKLNTSALLRMDPLTQAQVLAIKVDKRATTPNEWRALDDRPPLTPEQEDEFARLFARQTAAPAAAQPAPGSTA